LWKSPIVSHSTLLQTGLSIECFCKSKHI